MGVGGIGDRLAPLSGSWPCDWPGPGRARLLAHAILVLAVIWLAGPFLWEVLTAFKTLTEATSVPPHLAAVAVAVW